jgi:hypothetical protein
MSPVTVHVTKKKPLFYLMVAVSARDTRDCTLSYKSHTPTSARRPAGWWRARCFSALTVVWGGTSVQSAASTYGPQRLFIFRSRLFQPAKKLELKHAVDTTARACADGDHEVAQM